MTRTWRGFTLVELLVAIAIIAILAALLLGVAARAGETAREARTKQLVARIHTLLMEKYESYRTQRVEVREFANTPSVRAGIIAQTTGLIGVVGPPTPSDSQLRIYTRLAAIRELMKLEMPDRWSDVLLTEVQNPPVEITQALLQTPAYRTVFVEDRPALNALYTRRYNDARRSGATKAQIESNQGAECLYMTIMYATADGEARGLFKETDIGDTDGDGAPEFLDGWGNPISWLRWAPGFDSDAQLSYAGLVRVYNRDASGTQGTFGTSGVETAIVEDHDPLDLFRVDTFDVSGLTGTITDPDQLAAARGWRLLPLVYSAGPDEETGVRDEADNGAYVARADPYADIDPAAADSQWLGQPLDDPDAATDNITNHLITAR